MSYRFYVTVPAVSGSGREPIILEKAAATISPLASGVGAFTLTLPNVDPKNARLEAALKLSPVKLEVMRDGTFDPKLSGFVEYLGKATVSASGVQLQQYTGRFLGSILEDASLLPSLGATADTGGYIPSTYATAGAYMRGAIDYLQSHGFLSKLRCTFTTTTTTDGLPWGKTSKISVDIGSAVLELADQLATSTQWEYQVRDGFDGFYYLDGFNPGQRGRDLSASVFFLRGRDIGDSTREYRYDGKGTTFGVYAGADQSDPTGSSILYYEATDEQALARWQLAGRDKKIIIEQRQDIFDQRTLIDYVNAKLPSITTQNPQVEIRNVVLKVLHSDGSVTTTRSPEPFRDFDNADSVTVRAEEGWEDPYQLQQITLNVLQGGVAVSYDVVMGRTFLDPRIPLPAAASTNSSTNPTVNDQVPDPTPTGDDPNDPNGDGSGNGNPAGSGQYDLYGHNDSNDPAFSADPVLQGSLTVGRPVGDGNLSGISKVMPGQIIVTGGSDDPAAPYTSINPTALNVGGDLTATGTLTVGGQSYVGGVSIETANLLTTMMVSMPPGQEDLVDLVYRLALAAGLLTAPDDGGGDTGGGDTGGGGGTNPPGDTTISGAQTRNALNVIREVNNLGGTQTAALIALMTILAESDAKILASQAVPESINYPHDGVAPGDADSVGLYQQRAPWGSVQVRMGSLSSTENFCMGVPGVSGGLFASNGYQQVKDSYDTATAEELGAVAQYIQGSAFADGSNYAAQYAKAKANVDQLWQFRTSPPTPDDPDFGGGDSGSF